MKLRNLTVDGRVVSAPLANVSGSAYRLLAREFGASLVVSEMVSAEGLVRGNRKTISMLRFREAEMPVSIQLFGRSPDTLGEACKIVADTGVDMIDLNFGCPAKKIVNKCGGAALLKDAKLTEALMKSAVEAVDIPVSVKFRAGWDRESTNFLEIGKLAEQCGASMLTLHPRTKASGFRGKSDWSRIAELKESVEIPVVGSGDIVVPQDALDMIDQTGCDLVMIGRAAMGAPWIFRRVDEVLKGNPDPGELSLEQKIETCLRFAQLLIEDFGEKSGCLKARKHLAWFTRGWLSISQMRPAMFSVESYSDIVKIFDTYLQTCYKRTA
jgi:nifR3 family TIM-barrel protein